MVSADDYFNKDSCFMYRTCSGESIAFSRSSRLLSYIDAFEGSSPADGAKLANCSRAAKRREEKEMEMYHVHGGIGK